MSSITLVWLRRDLRLDDNPALAAAAQRGLGTLDFASLNPIEKTLL